MVTPLSKLGKGATFFGQVLPIIRSQRQLGYLFGSIPSPPQMIEEVSTGKEGTTTKTLVQNPAYEDWICTASTPPFLQKFWRRDSESFLFGKERTQHPQLRPAFLNQTRESLKRTYGRGSKKQQGRDSTD
ncbi:hypothetical protein MRB53_036516 [Persea americana]|nr:hypothetical protein MRB53_036516 [Persea americana]